MQLQDLQTMQADQILPFFQDLFGQTYELVLNNPLNIGCLVVAVWLLTSIFFSIRIAALNNRNNANLKTILDIQNRLAAAQLQVQDSQMLINVHQKQLEHETQRTVELQERINELAGQLTDSITALAAEPGLGQQGLTVSPGLQAEHLWQRYRAAVSQMAENLIAQRKTSADLRSEMDVQTAKLAEKSLELQALQLRFDNQKHQLVKLEMELEEQKNLLSRQEEITRQKLAEFEGKFQADIARYAQTEKLVKASVYAPQAVLQEKPEIQLAADSVIAALKVAESDSDISVNLAQAEVQERPVADLQPDAQTSVESTPAKPQAGQAKAIIEKSAGGLMGKFKSMLPISKPKADKPLAKSTVIEPKPQAVTIEEPDRIVPDTREPEPVAPEVTVKPKPATAAKSESTGKNAKTKNLFADVIKKFEKFDQKLGSGSVPPQAVEPEVTQPAVVVPEIKSIELEVINVATPEAAVDKNNLGGKVKSLFGLSKPAIKQQPVETPIAEPESVAPEKVAQADSVAKSEKGVSGQINKLFGKLKRKG